MAPLFSKRWNGNLLPAEKHALGTRRDRHVTTLVQNIRTIQEVLGNKAPGWPTDLIVNQLQFHA
jgi:hypothetical protein